MLNPMHFFNKEFQNKLLHFVISYLKHCWTNFGEVLYCSPCPPVLCYS